MIIKKKNTKKISLHSPSSTISLTSKTQKSPPKILLKSQEEESLKKNVLVKAQELISKQQRFNNQGTSKNSSKIFHSIFSWASDIEDSEPRFDPLNSSKRDLWLAEVVKKEPFLNSVLTSVITVDRNRGWNIVGGRNYVKSSVDILHKIKVNPDIKGWRHAMSAWSQSYHGSDLGAIIEPEFKNGKLYSIYPVDPTQCSLTGKPDFPLLYKGSPNQEWKSSEYLRITDSPSYLENFYGIGNSAVSRAIELSRLMIAIWQHDKEKLLAKAPRGILFLKGISEQQWNDTLQSHEQQMTALERKYYNGVQILASDGLGDISAQLMSLSELPDGLSQIEFTNLIMMFYALAFGYDPREFWPVNSGNWGTSMEAQMQHQKASQKGGMDFILNLQESLQSVLPYTVNFEFEQRDSTADAAEEAFKSQVISNILMLSTPIGAEQTPLLSKTQILTLLAAENIIPQEWADNPNFLLAEDTEDNASETQNPLLRSKSEEESIFFEAEQIKYLPHIERSLFHSPNEPIIKYRSKTNSYKVIPVPPLVRKTYFLP